MIGSKTTRRRVLYPKLLFRILLELVSSTNCQGYCHALVNVFSQLKCLERVIAKSALTKMRSRVSYQFFQALFEKLIHIHDPDRQTYRGLRVYAVDGAELAIPRSQDTLSAGYDGRALVKKKKTYHPHMYLTHAYDVFSGVTKKLLFGPNRQELLDALDIIPSLEKMSLCLYDRLFMSKVLIKAHAEHGSYFLCRIKTNAFKVVQEFSKSNRRIRTVTICGEKIRLFKIRIPKTSEYALFATNITHCWMDSKTVFNLYSLRWQVENSFRDTNCSLKIKQWHSKSLNGVLQELFCTYWLMNFARIQIAASNVNPSHLLNSEYEKPNFKLILNWIIKRFPQSLRVCISVERELEFLINYSTEKRRRNSRHYPRQIKSSRRFYKRACAIERSA